MAVDKDANMNELNINIRLATVGDAEAIAAIYNHYVRIGGATFDTVPWSAEQVVEAFSVGPSDLWLIASDAAEVLGWASARQFSSRPGYRLSLESAIYLSTGAVGKGVADRLQAELETKCRRRNIHHLMARIVTSNERSMAFHRRHGYTIVGVQNEIGHMDGHWVDVTILQNLL